MEILNISKCLILHQTKYVAEILENSTRWIAIQQSHRLKFLWEVKGYCWSITAQTAHEIIELHIPKQARQKQLCDRRE